MPLDASGGLRHALQPQRMLPGHRLRVLAGGGEAYPAMLEAIASARREICLETYIWAPDATGRRFAAALAERARAGVAVRVIVDGAGSFNLDAAVWEPLVEAGAEVAVFHPVAPWRRRWGWSVRDHRKVLVVDGSVAFLGGLNLADEYAPRAEPWNGGGWRDVHLRVEGPAVADLHAQFAATSRYVEQHAPSLPAPAAVDLGGDARAQALWVGRRRERKFIQRQFLYAVHTARASVWIESAYFIPNRSWRRALAAAARRGVDVRVLVPRVGDVPGIRWASSYTWTGLLAAGVRIYEFLPTMLHAKTLLVDGAWAAVGSYNLDQRSFLYNWEVALAMVDPGVCAALHAQFEADQADSRQVDAALWSRRSVLDRARERFFYFFRLWL